MNTQKNAPRLLGTAFLLVAVVSLGSGLLLSSVVGSGSISAILVHVSRQGNLLRLSSLGELATSAGIVAWRGCCIASCTHSTSSSRWSPWDAGWPRPSVLPSAR
jgi:hypothetical protein